MDGVTVYGTDNCEDTRRTREHLERAGIRYRYVNLDENRFASEQVEKWNSGKRRTPTVVLAGRRKEVRLAEPSNEELDRELGLAGIRRQRQWGELAK